MAEIEDEIRAKLLEFGHQAAQGFLPDEDFNMYYQQAKDTAVENMTRDGNLTMVFIMHGTDVSKDPDSPERHVGVVAGILDWPDELDKNRAMQGLGMKFVDDNPGYILTAVCHISEGWAARYKTGTPAKDLKPAEDPDRVEVAIVHAASMDQRISYCYLKTGRDADGKFTGFTTLNEEIWNSAKPPVVAHDPLVANIFKGYFDATKPQQKAQA